jgi:hypothetical protein
VIFRHIAQSATNGTRFIPMLWDLKLFCIVYLWYGPYDGRILVRFLAEAVGISFPKLSKAAVGPTQPPFQWVLEVKQSEHRADM